MSINTYALGKIEIKEDIDNRSQRKLARVAGLLYLIIIIAGMKLGVNIRLGAPKAYQPDPALVARYKAHAVAGAEVVITDDFEAFPELRQATQVRVHLSPYLIAALVVAGRLSLQEAKACFDRIARRRHWFDARLYQRARGYLNGLLAE